MTLSGISAPEIRRELGSVSVFLFPKIGFLDFGLFYFFVMKTYFSFFVFTEI